MKKLLLLTFCLLCFRMVLSAQEVRGLAVDRKSGEPVSFASIRVNDRNVTVADSAGQFTLQLQEGTHLISISKVGYLTMFQTLRVSEGDKISYSFMLDAYNNELQSIVISSSRQEKELAREAVSITSIKQDLIINTNSNTLSDVLNRVPGVSVVEGQAIIRGGVGWSYNVGSRVMVLLDDMPLMGPDAGDIQWDFLPIEAAENIEVMKGPASVLYGSSASSGTVSVRTGWPVNKPETRIQTYHGITATPKREYTAWWEPSAQPFNSGAFFSHKQKFGQFDLVASGNVDLVQSYIEQNDQHRIRGYLKTRYRFKEVPGLSVQVGGNLMYKKGGRFFLWLDGDTNVLRPFNGSTGVDNYRIWSIDPAITYARPKYTLSFKMRLYHVTRFADYTDTLTLNRTNDAVAKAVAYDLSFLRKWTPKFSTTAGLYFTPISAIGNLYPGKHFGYTAAAFLQAEYVVHRNLTLTAGARYEVNAVDEKQTSPGPLFRAGLNYKAARKTYLRATYGEGFRFPTITERSISDSLKSFVILANPELKNEYGWYAEIGIKQGFRIGGFNASFDYAFFWQEYQNLIQFEFRQWKNDTFYLDMSTTPPTPKVEKGVIGFKAINMGLTRTAGMEVSLEGQGNIGAFGIRTLCGYTYIYPVNLEADTTLKNVKKYMKNFVNAYDGLDSAQLHSLLPFRNRKLVKADIEVSFKRYSVGYGLFYYSVYEKIDAPLYILVPGIGEFLDRAAPGDWVHNLRCSYTFNSYFSVGFLVNNITNREYAVRLARIEPPRNFNLQLRFRF